MKKRLICIITAIAAAPMLLGGCGNNENTAGTLSTAATEAVSTETTEASSEQIKEDSEQTDSQLTTYLQYIEDNFCSDAYAGISIRSAGCAVDMMNWYMDEKPSDNAIAETAKEYILSLPESDRSAFSQGVTMVYESARQVAGENGEELAADAGYTGEITWAESDADNLFQAIFKGFDVE